MANLIGACHPTIQPPPGDLAASGFPLGGGIDDGSITNVKLAAAPTLTVKSNLIASTAAPQDAPLSTLAGAISLGLTRAGLASLIIPLSAVQVRGFATPGDDGEGAIYVSSTTAGLMGVQAGPNLWWNLSLGNGAVRPGWFGAKGDNASDDGPAIQLAINAMAPGTLLFSQRTYLVFTPLTGKAGIILAGQAGIGSNIHRAPVTGSIIENRQSTGPMITFPGSADLIGEAGTNWGFRDIILKGGQRPVAIVSAPEQNPSGRGSWSPFFHRVLFDGGRPAISIANGWDGWISSCGFQRCGPATGGPGSNLGECCVYFFNSSQSYVGAGSNSWRITDCFFDITSGRGLVFDNSGPGIPCTGFHIEGNHFGPTGYDSIYGGLSGSRIVGNFSEGSISGYPIFNLFGVGGRGGCSANVIANNTLNTPGTVAILEGQAADLITGNVFQGDPGSGQYISLTAQSFICRVTNNYALNGAATNTTPMCATDLGLGNTVAENRSSDNALAGNEIKRRQDGVNVYAPVSPQSGLAAYTPTIAATSGTITTLGTVTAKYKTVGPMTYVSARIPITTNGTGAGNLTATLPVTPTGDASLAGRDANGGRTLGVSVVGGQPNAFVTVYDASYPGYNGAILVISGWYPTG